MRNRGIFALLGICLFLLLIVVAFIIFLNRPTSSPRQTVPSPTPLPNQASGGSSGAQGTPRPTIANAPMGETEFTKENTEAFQKSAQQAEQAYQSRLQRMPFITKLPYTTNHFRIEITASSDTVYIRTYGAESYRDAYRQEALNWLRQNGGNPQTLQISYRN